MWGGCFFTANYTKRVSGKGIDVKKKVRAVYRTAGEPARIVVCEADLGRIAGRSGAEIGLQYGEARWYGKGIEFAAVIFAHGRETGMCGWTDAAGGRWYGPALAFGMADGEIAGLGEEEAEAVRRFLDGDEEDWD